MSGSEPRQPGALVAVLLNPPARTTGTRTRNAVARAAAVLGYAEVRVVNLCAAPSPSVVELNRQASGESWLLARAEIRTALSGAGEMLGAWGVAGITGHVRQARDEQVSWLYAAAALAGSSHIWMVGGEPRHPSRWHQFVCDKYGRTTGGTFENRLKQVLRPVALPAFSRVGHNTRVPSNVES